MIRAVLGLDQAARSGWAITLDRKVVEHGLALTHVDRVDVARRALVLAGGDPAALLVAFEDHGAMPLDRLTKHDRVTERRRQGAPERSTRSILGQGKAYGRWEAVLDELGHPARLRMDVEPCVWRRRVHGVVKGDVKQAAIDWASRHVGVPIEDNNEAEGICLAVFASMDGVAMLEHEQLQKRLVRASKRQHRQQLVLGGTHRLARGRV